MQSIESWTTRTLLLVTIMHNAISILQNTNNRMLFLIAFAYIQGTSFYLRTRLNVCKNQFFILVIATSPFALVNQPVVRIPTTFDRAFFIINSSLNFGVMMKEASEGRESHKGFPLTVLSDADLSRVNAKSQCYKSWVGIKPLNDFTK